MPNKMTANGTVKHSVVYINGLGKNAVNGKTPHSNGKKRNDVTTATTRFHQCLLERKSSSCIQYMFLVALVTVVVCGIVLLPEKFGFVIIQVGKVPNAFMGNNLNRTMSAKIPSKLAVIPAGHIKARGETYPRNDTIRRYPVPEDKISWDVPYPNYVPTDYTAPSVTCQPVWADWDIRQENHKDQVPQYNIIDDKVDRRSHTGPYQVLNNLPRNPVGRTGVTGRGLLGRWGPNHAADPIVTRWKILGSKQVKHVDSRKPILQFIAIQRRDSGEWALPGGMVSPGEHVSVTLKREFGEETMNSLEVSDEEKDIIAKQVADLFREGTEVYRGYVDDPRNTDNSWMETVAYNFHDETGTSVGRFKLHAGDDAVGVKWIDIDRANKLYASHHEFIQRVAKLHNAHW